MHTFATVYLILLVVLLVVALASKDRPDVAEVFLGIAIMVTVASAGLALLALNVHAR